MCANKLIKNMCAKKNWQANSKGTKVDSKANGNTLSYLISTKWQNEKSRIKSITSYIIVNKKYIMLFSCRCQLRIAKGLVRLVF